MIFFTTISIILIVILLATIIFIEIFKNQANIAAGWLFKKITLEFND